MMTKMRMAWRRHHPRWQAGTSLAEVMVTLGIITIVMGVGVLGLDRDFLDLDTARQMLVNDLRMARMQATLKGVRFRVTLGAGGYRIERLVDTNGTGNWQVDGSYAAKTVNLPSGYALTSTSTAGSATTAEFDGRGLLVAQPNGTIGVISIVLSDDDGRQKAVKLWPSGQVDSPSATVATS
jgi:Tfp pilus assembly protein FimT